MTPPLRFGFVFPWLLLGVAIASGPAAARDLSRPEELKQLSLEELLNIKVITVSRTPESWKTIPAAIGVITPEEIHGSGALRLADVLRLAPGLHVARYGGSSYGISARGFNTTAGNKLQVLMDGRSLYTPLLSGVFWEMQDTLIDDIERVEVVRGPGATMWGSNAVNGVIAIVTKNAQDTQGTLVTAGFGNEERSFGGLRYGGKLGETTYYRTYFKYHRRDDQILSNGVDSRDDMQQSQGGFRLDSSVAGGNEFTLQGDVYLNHFGVLGRADAKNKGGNLLGRWKHEFSPRSGLQVQAYYDRGIRDVPQQFREDRTTWDVDVQQRFDLGERHEIVVGGSHRRSEDTTANTGNRTFVFAPKDRTIRLDGFFLQDKFTVIPEELTLYLGTKSEHNDFTGWEVQPNFRVSYVPRPQQVVWAAVSRAVRAPTRVDADSRFIPIPASGFVAIRGTPEFRSEEVMAWELGHRFQPNEGVFVDLALFRNEYDHLRTLEPSPAGSLVISNLREGGTQGAELALTLQGRKWRLMGSYTYYDEMLTLKPGSRDTTVASLEGNDPPYLATLHFAVTLPKNVQFDGVLRHVARRPGAGTPGYTALDVRVAVQPAVNWEIAVVGQNLLDPRHSEFAGTGVQSQIQRGVFGQLTYRR